MAVPLPAIGGCTAPRRDSRGRAAEAAAAAAAVGTGVYSTLLPRKTATMGCSRTALGEARL
eukprot:2959471-Pleurochrysis_carterae.AAC.2